MSVAVPDNLADHTGLTTIRTHLAATLSGLDLERLWLVGGSVRDLLLDQPVHDLDLLTTLPDRELERHGFRPVTPKSGHPLHFRADSRYGSLEVICLASTAEVAADLRRRDFTCNAIALGLDGTILDPLCGRSDLADRQLRPCTPTAFQADPARLARACRFVADGWELPATTRQLMASQGISADLADVPAERLARELQKALAASRPQEFFRLLVQLGIGRGYLSELFRMPTIPAGPIDKHPEGDLLSHSLQVLERLSACTSDPLARFCALFHDLGKLATEPAHYPRHHGHNRTGASLATAFCRRLRLPGRYATALAASCRLHDTANHWQELTPASKLRLAGQARQAQIADFLPLLVAADHPRSELADWPVALHLAGLSATDIGIPLSELQRLAPAQRANYLHQQRVTRFRALTDAPAPAATPFK